MQNISLKFIFILAVLPLLMTSWSRPCHAGDGADVRILDVGYGSCAMVTVGSRHFLFDTGSAKTSHRVVKACRRSGIDRFDAVFLTHAHEDHIGALAKILAHVPAATIYWNGKIPDDKRVAAVLAETKDHGRWTTVRRSTEIRLSDDATVTIHADPTTEEDLNESGLVYVLERSGRALVFPGDAGPERQRRLMRTPGFGGARAALFLWPHHGDTVDPDFLAAFSPIAWCVVSVGKNDYGLPREEITTIASEHCRNFARTDRTGDLFYSWGTDGALEPSPAFQEMIK